MAPYWNTDRPCGVGVIGSRIAERLKLLDNMSQSELARRVGLTQGTIAQLISGRSRSSSHLHKIARELKTTPAYLSGETDDPAAPEPISPDLSADQRELMQLYEAMDDASRRALMQVARSMGNPPPTKPTLHSPKLAYAGGTPAAAKG